MPNDIQKRALRIRIIRQQSTHKVNKIILKCIICPVPVATNDNTKVSSFNPLALRNYDHFHVKLTPKEKSSKVTRPQRKENRPGR